MFKGKHACLHNLRCTAHGQNTLLQAISKVLIIITISSQNASLPPRYDVLVDAVLDAAVAGLLHLGRHFFNLTLTSKGIFLQRGSLPLDLSRPFSQKAREALFFFLPSFPRLCLSAGSVTRRLPPPPLPPRPSSVLLRTDGRRRTGRRARASIG